jgi:hypothetical protein
MSLSTEFDDQFYIADSWDFTPLQYGRPTVLDVEWYIERISGKDPVIKALNCHNFPVIGIYPDDKGRKTADYPSRHWPQLREVRDYLNGGPYPENVIGDQIRTSHMFVVPGGSLGVWGPTNPAVPWATRPKALRQGHGGLRCY